MSDQNSEADSGMRKRNIAQLCACISGVAAVYVFCVATILVANHLVQKYVDPIDHPVLEELKSAISRYPADAELKETFRNVDSQVRNAFYRSETVAERGKWLLALGIAVLLAGLQGIHLATKRPPTPGTADEKERAREPILLRRAVVSAGIALAVFAVVFSLNRESPRDLLVPDGEEPEKTTGNEAGEPAFDSLAYAWPAFRGPGGQGVSSHNDVPIQWDGKTGANIRWKVRPPKRGFSSPVIFGKKLFITGADDDSREIYCYNTESGDLLWSAVANDIVGTPLKLPEVSEDTGFAAPTTTTDGKRVYAVFATGDVLAIDTEGKRVWAQNLGLPDNPYGHASSPIVHNGRLLVQYDHFGSAQLIALDARTGKQLWKQERHVSASWASPVLMRNGERVTVICNAEPLVAAYDAFSGELRWECECMSGEVGPSVAVDSGLAFATTDYAVLAAIHTGGTEKDGTVAWKTEEELPDVSSPVAFDGLLYTATSAGIITCYESTTGKRLWMEEFPNGFYSSPIIVGKRLYALDMQGLMHIIAADKTFKEIGTASLGEGTVCTPAPQTGRLYIRGLENLYCIGK